MICDLELDYADDLLVDFRLARVALQKRSQYKLVPERNNNNKLLLL
jgi:hypothetical protein